MAKVFLIMFMAYLLEKKQDKLDDFSYGFLPFILIPGVIMLLVLGQPDFGTFILMGMLIYIMMFVGGVRITYLIGVVAVVIPVLYLLITHSHYRLMRFLVFLDPWKYYSKNGYQVAQSLISFGAGGFIGKGIGCSQQKMFFLPEAYTDYIFSIFAEEMGFFGVFAVVVSFLLFFVTGIKMSMKVQNRFGKLLGIGLTSLITLQAFINFSVCMGLLPPKGITLPFFSYGGSSLVAVMFAVGVLLNLSRNVAND
jgi:cell division protein FtsW